MSFLRPFLAASLAVLWFTAPITSELHFLLVEHSVCLEHGALTEEEGAGASETGQHHDHEHGEGPVLASSAAHDEGHDHDCGFLLPPSPNLGSKVAILVQPSTQSFPSLRVSDASAPRAPPLSFAPKTSPPRS